MRRDRMEDGRVACGGYRRDRVRGICQIEEGGQWIELDIAKISQVKHGNRLTA